MGFVGLGEGPVAELWARWSCFEVVGGKDLGR